MWTQIKANPKLYAIIGAVGLVVIVALFLLIGAGINSYKESQFQKRQAEYQKEIDAAKTQATVAESQANAAKDQAKAKDAEVQQLQAQIDDLKQQTEQKRVVYINSRKPVVLRPPGSGVDDASLRADAKRLGLSVR